MQDQGSWSDCPSGVVTEMARELRRRRQRTQLRPFMAAGLAFLLISVIGYGLTNRDTPVPRAALNCRDTIQLLAKYHAGSLDAVGASGVREHLSHCPKCRKYYDETFPSEVRNHSSVESRLLVAATHFRR
jgi:hypothetical protein